MEKYNKLFSNITELIENSLLTSKDLKKELDNIIKNNVEIFASKLNLVSREEFEVQKKIVENLRKKLDKLDNVLLKVIKKRTDIVKEVLTLKSSKKDIIDKKRISIILKKIKYESIKKKIDPKITNRIWKNMIWSYIDFEKRNFKKK